MFLPHHRSLTRPGIWAMPLLTLGGALAIHLLQLNLPLFHLINSNALNLFAPSLWESLTILGDGLIALALLLPLHREHPRPVLSALIAGLIAAVWVHLLKSGLALPRPASVLGQDSITVLGPLLRQGSFPSGHTATLFVLLGCSLLWMRGRWLRTLFAPFLIIGLLAAASRVAVGAHWPQDIFAGAAIGWISALIGSFVASRFTLTSVTVSWLGRFLTACALYTLFARHTGYGAAQTLQHGIALCALGLSSLEHLKRGASGPMRLPARAEDGIGS